MFRKVIIRKLFKRKSFTKNKFKKWKKQVKTCKLPKKKDKEKQKGL